jgi:hypothetical protein
MSSTRPRWRATRHRSGLSRRGVAVAATRVESERLALDLPGVFGSDAFAREELLAELGAVLLGDRLEVGGCFREPRGLLPAVGAATAGVSSGASRCWGRRGRQWSRWSRRQALGPLKEYEQMLMRHQECLVALT